MIVQISPTRINLIGYEDKLPILKSHLEYIDKSVDYEILKFKKNQFWYISRHGPEEYQDRLNDLKAKRKQSLLFQDDDDTYFTYSGLGPFLAAAFNDELKIEYDYPEPKLIPLDHKFKHDPRPYQTEAVDLLMKAKHGAVALPTGSGKSFCIALLLKYYGLKSVIATPSISIAGQIYRELVYLFGKKYVGRFYQGKKESNKLFIVAVNDSLIRVEENSNDFNELAKVQVLINDEVHRVAAETLHKAFILGPLQNAPYRFGLSGTVFRNDGKDLLLNAIIGPTVLEKSLWELVDQGYLAKPEFKTVWLDSDKTVKSDDPKKTIQGHVYKNPQVAKVAGDLINHFVNELKLQTVVLIEEFSQFTALMPYLSCDFRFAHSGATKDNKAKIPKEYHKSDVDKFVTEFNELKYPLLIGTDCICTGTDMPPIGAILYLKGISSPIDVSQACGRGTRLVPGKKDFLFVDIGINNVPMLKNQALKRKAIYQSIYDTYEDIYL